MMEGENVKASTTIFQPTTTQGSASSPDSSSGACAAEKSFSEFIRHQVQALIVWFFIIKNKEQALRRPAEARLRTGKRL